MTRDEACWRYRHKVSLLARRVHERLAPDATVSLDDLISSGSLGLLEAFDRFEAARGIQFSTYAEYRIRGAMYDDLRKGDTFTRRRRQLAKKIERAIEEMRRELDRDPEPMEVADYLGITLDQFFSDVDRTKPVTLVSLDSGAESDEESRPLIERLIAGAQNSPDNRLKVDDIRSRLKDAILQLPERQRQCVAMYYGKDEMSLAEIAEVYGVTVSRISQILGDAKRKLRKKLEPLIESADFDHLEFHG